MSVLLTRIGTPHPGKQSEALKYAHARRDAVNKNYGLHANVYLRFGGPVGQVVMVESFADVAAVEKLKREIVAATQAGTFNVSPADVFDAIEEHVWISTDE
ncbi:MAG: hypothetical protein LBQ32_02120 [Burkholderiaceae bacterium]|nr:hypothetical protein [Burkholderiaceae bacterium]